MFPKHLHFKQIPKENNVQPINWISNGKILGKVPFKHKSNFS